MTSWGVTPQGFVLKPVQQLIAEFNADLLHAVPPDTDLSPDQPLGQLIGIACKKLGEVWQLAQVGYNATNRGDAEDDLLDNIGDLTGTKRAPQSPSTVACAAFFSAAGTYAAGALGVCLAPPASSSVQFKNAVQIVVPGTGANGGAISATNTWPNASGPGVTLTLAGTTVTLTLGNGFAPHDVGQNITIGGSANVANNGTFPVVTQPSGTSVTYTNSNAGAATDATAAAYFFMAPSATFVFESTVDGPTFGDALIGANQAAGKMPGQLSHISIPAAGWTMVADLATPGLGSLTELDPAYRVRQELELSSPGSDTLDATRAAILIALQNAPIALTPLGSASVQAYENTGLTTDGNNLPGKSYLLVVYDGTPFNEAQNNALIGQAIWNNHPAGIQSVGTQAVQVPDSTGVLRTVYFTRPSVVNVTVAMDVAVPLSMTGAAWAALSAAIGIALTNATQGLPFTLYGATFAPGVGALTTLVPGQDVVANALKSIVQGQPGVIDVQNFVLSPGPNSAGNIPIDISHVGFVTTVTPNRVTFMP